MICYAAVPNACLNAHAPEVKQICVGLFFSIGSWESGVPNALDLESVEAVDPLWIKDN